MSAEQKLRFAIRTEARRPTDQQKSTEEATRSVLSEAGIEVTPRQFRAAAIEMARCPFYGGNFLLDACRVIKAIEAAS